MEIIQLSLPQGNFYNPDNGEFITDGAYDSIKNGIKSLKGLWNHEIIDSPDLFDRKLAEAWDTQYDAFSLKEDESLDGGYLYTDYEQMLEKFLKEFEHENWAAFKVLNTEFGCGPSTCINWYVLDFGIKTKNKT